VFEKLQGLTWQFLHDGPRTLRATEMRLALGRATLPEQALLRDRVRVLHRYANLTEGHGQPWPPTTADGHTPWPAEGCGAFPGETSAPASRGRGHGGWQTTRPEAADRWGGENRCTIRVLSFEEWETAAPECLAALFTRPFLVTSGAVSGPETAIILTESISALHATTNTTAVLVNRSNRRWSSIAGTRTNNFSLDFLLKPLLIVSLNHLHLVRRTNSQLAASAIFIGRPCLMLPHKPS
jgi:hypothetical protein